MNPRHVDTTTLYGVVRALECGQPAQCNEWAFQNLVDVTGDLIRGRQLLRSFVPGAAGQEDPRIVAIMAAAGGQIRDDCPPLQDRQDAEEVTRVWVAEKITSIRERFQCIVNDKNTAADWSEWHIKREWKWRVEQRMQSLTDTAFKNEVETILDTDKQIAQAMFNEVGKMCEDRTKFKLLIQGTSSDLETACKVWWASILTRGVYYAYLTLPQQCDCMQHPVRGDLKPDAYVSNSPDRTDNPQWWDYLARILTVLVQRKSSDAERLQEWHDFVRRTKYTLKPNHVFGFLDAEDVPNAVAQFAREELRVTNVGNLLQAAGDMVSRVLGRVVDKYTFEIPSEWGDRLKSYSVELFRRIGTRVSTLRTMAVQPTIFEIRRGRAKLREENR